jgi:hypothetical protein
MLSEQEKLNSHKQGIYSKIFLLWLVYLVPIIHFNYFAIGGISSYFSRRGQNDDAFILLAITLLVDIIAALSLFFFTKKIKQNKLNSFNLYIIWMWILFSLAYFYMVNGVWSAP